MTENDCFIIEFDTSNKLIDSELTAAEWRIWCYLSQLDPSIDSFSPEKTRKRCNVSKSTYFTAIAKLSKAGLIPDWIDYTPQEYKSIESTIRDNLQAQLGGLTEVTTPSGRIDLLTETEIIEVKNIKDWKAALGQILVYSAFYPDHKKRIHLFGQNIDNLTDLELYCLPFGVAVTGELT